VHFPSLDILCPGYAVIKMERIADVDERVRIYLRQLAATGLIANAVVVKDALHVGYRRAAIVLSEPEFTPWPPRGTVRCACGLSFVNQQLFVAHSQQCSTWAAHELANQKEARFRDPKVVERRAVSSGGGSVGAMSTNAISTASNAPSMSSLLPAAASMIASQHALEGVSHTRVMNEMAQRYGAVHAFLADDDAEPDAAFGTRRRVLVAPGGGLVRVRDVVTIGCGASMLGEVSESVAARSHSAAACGAR
jgi:hypothetical protein